MGWVMVECVQLGGSGEVGLEVVDMCFGAAFWDDAVQYMRASSVGLSNQLMIVPDGSLSSNYRQGWARWVRAQGVVSVVPDSMTLLNWARRFGAIDWDATHTERLLQWLQTLPSVPALLAALGHAQPNQLLSLARQLIEMSDELSVHLLPQFDLGVVGGAHSSGSSGASKALMQVQAAVTAAIEGVYEASGFVLARDEVQVLLSCWAADVGRGTPVIEYLQVLQTMAANPPKAHVWVVRNRDWTAHELAFWERYALAARVTVLDVSSVQVVAGTGRWEVLQRLSAVPERYVTGAEVGAVGSDVSTQVPVFAAGDVEDEAQAVVAQVLLWLAEDAVERIALVALDRQVSRRVWALLQRVGVDIRDDTGWLLSTSRAASAWHSGLRVLQGEVDSEGLLDWLAHPLVLAHWRAEDKEHLVRTVHLLADEQVGYERTVVWRTWSEWLVAAVKALSRVVRAHELSADVTMWLAELGLGLDEGVHKVSFERLPEGLSETLSEALMTRLLERVDVAELAVPLRVQVQGLIRTVFCVRKAQAWSVQWHQSRCLADWAGDFRAWAEDFGMWEALYRDAAGALWCGLLTRWMLIEDAWPMPLGLALNIMDSEVEDVTYRPERVSELSAERVVLMPLGNTRLRAFDAVWVMGADAGNLPGALTDAGLLNTAVRSSLGLPNVTQQQAVLREALWDVFAVHTRVQVSYCRLKDGAPNGLSPWLMQYVRACGARVVTIVPTVAEALDAQCGSGRARSAVVIGAQGDGGAVLPESLSATSVKRLATCPYQFFAAEVLAVRSSAEPDWALTASDVGTVWHQVVERFARSRHSAMMRACRSFDATGDVRVDEDEALPSCASDEALFAVCVAEVVGLFGQGNPRFWALLPDFESFSPSFVSWWRAREAQGWRWRASEFRPTSTSVWSVPLPNASADGVGAHDVALKGRIDQVDVDADGAWSLIDFKTNDLKRHRQELAKGEDVQLAFYVNMLMHSGQSVADALYVGVAQDGTEVPEVHLVSECAAGSALLGEVSEDLAQASLKEAAELLEQTVVAHFAAMVAGEPLRALGEAVACGYCDYRAVCRRDYAVSV